MSTRIGLRTVLREWGRLGLIGFGGPPAHVALLRRLCVDERRWIDARAFEDANAACQLLPGPASTQLAIFCAHRVGGARGAVVGGLAFILPGLVALIALAALTLGDDPPTWVLGAAAGAGAAVVAVVVQAGVDLGRTGVRSLRAAVYLAVGFATTVLLGPWVVLALVGCGVVELVWRRGTPPALLSVAALPALAWVAFQVGALSYGGGFVIVPLMQGEAVDGRGWMTEGEFLSAVALGQLTPGPVVQTVAAVGWAAAGLGGALLAAAIAFAPSFLVVLLGGARFERLRRAPGPRAFLDGAGPAAVGAILGAAVPLLAGVDEAWQVAVLAVAALLLARGRGGVVVVLLGAAAAGAVIAAAGGPLPPR
ncbi:MAG TPA: chromate transporter [Baekduia sp.]|nr:chromate transporter [Baekduia sp.]